MVQLNAVAIGMAEGPQRGLALIDELGAAGELDRYHLFHAARADMLRRLGAFEAAADACRRTLALMPNGVERPIWNAGWRPSDGSVVAKSADRPRKGPSEKTRQSLPDRL